MSQTKRTVLVVDDDPDIVEVTRTILETAGYNVVSAMDGAGGLAKARETKPDLIILDVMMGSTTEGFHVAYEIRKDPQIANTPILMLTAIEGKTGMKFSPDKDGDYLPVEEFVSKPIQPDDLLARVDRLIKGAKKS